MQRDNDDKNKPNELPDDFKDNAIELPKGIWNQIFGFFTREELGRGPAQVSRQLHGTVMELDKHFHDKFKRCFPEEYEKIIRGSNYREDWKVTNWEAAYAQAEQEASVELTETGRALLNVIKEKDINVLQKFLTDHAVSLADLEVPYVEQPEMIRINGALPPLPPIVCFDTDKTSPLLWAQLHGFPEGGNEIYARVITPACENQPDLLLRWAIRAGQSHEEIKRCYAEYSKAVRQHCFKDTGDDLQQKNIAAKDYLDNLAKAQVEFMIEACRAGNAPAASFFFLKMQRRDNSVKIISELGRKLISGPELLAYAKVYCELLKKLKSYFVWSPNHLVHACENRALQATKYYLENVSNIDVDAVSDVNKRALIEACVVGGVAMVDLLCEKGAKVNAELADDDNAPTNLNLVRVNCHRKAVTPLLVASARNNLASVKCLVAYHANVNEPQVLQILSEYGSLPLLEFLIEHKLDCSKLSLDEACLRISTWGDEPVRVIQLLQENGARLSNPNKALMHACANCQADVVQYLLENSNPDVNLTCEEGRPLLRDTLYRGAIDVCRLLITHGANADVLTQKMINDYRFQELIDQAKSKAGPKSH
jgi:ankyrin repeat protein